MGMLGFYQDRYVAIDEPVIKLEDRGYQFGDGVYEVIVVYQGRYFALQEHLDRLERSCRELRFTPSYSRREIEEICYTLLEKSGLEDAMVYLQWSRGVAPRNHLFPADIKSILTATIRPPKVLAPEMFEKGVKAIIQPDERWLRCDIKTTNLLGSVLAKQKAAESGCFEAILARDHKIITEASVSNSFAVKDGVIYTSPTGNLILAGVTRAIVIELAQKLGIPVREEFVTVDFYRQADEVFLTGTTTEVMPVVVLDEKPLAQGQVGPVTRKLQESFRKYRGLD